MAKIRLKRRGLKTNQGLVKPTPLAVDEKLKTFDLTEMVSKLPKSYQPEEVPITLPLGKEEWQVIYSDRW